MALTSTETRPIVLLRQFGQPFVARTDLSFGSIFLTNEVLRGDGAK